jgi:hypothetical protein
MVEQRDAGSTSRTGRARRVSSNASSGYLDRRRAVGRPLDAIFRDPKALGITLELEP